MRTIVKNGFGTWLLLKLEEKGWSQSDLARAAGVSRTAISDAISSKRGVGRRLAASIAHGLKMPVEEVYRAAGILPPDPKENPWVKDIMNKLDQLDPAKRKMAEWLINKLADDDDGV